MAKHKLKKIFLIDDDPTQNEMLKTFLLDKFNLDITTFSTAEDAINNMHQKPAFVILDYNLDRVKKEAMNGIEALQKIKSLDKDVFVIMLSGQDKIEVAVETMKYGAFDYVIKNPTGFLRVENILNNIYSNLHHKNMARVYRTATIVLSSAIILFIILSIILKKMGIATENLFWG